MEMHFRQLVPGDEALAEAFLGSRPTTTMILRSNLRKAGLSYSGAAFEGIYVAGFDDEGAITGVAAHYWNGNLVLATSDPAAPDGPAFALVERVIALSTRAVRGLLGPGADVDAARRASGLTSPRHESREVLFALDLADLVIPPALTEQSIETRTPKQDELPMLLEWRMAYAYETSRIADTPQTREEQGRSLAAFHAHGHDVLALAAGQPVAYSGFNAEMPEMVQVGGVWTPPELRGHGYARCAVAGALVAARARGVGRAILFTGTDNLAAQRCYAKLGFQAVGDYALVFE
jgi:uncharacterized protein